jgi:NADH-quinone oxidoreductase subunit I
MTLKEFVNRVFLIEILKGMALTFKMMFTHAVTRQFPEERRDPIPGFRGRHAFVRDSKTGKEKCIMCMKCATVCPSQCIYITKQKREEDGKLYLAQFDIEALRCIFCGYCVEVCPVCALVLTEEFEYSAYTREEIYFTREKLLRNWDEFAAKQKTDTYFNKFWRPEGIDTSKMTKAKREQGPVSLRMTVTPPEAAKSLEEKETA